MEGMSDLSLENEAVTIWKFIYGFCDTLVLKCCVNLEIADTIHKHGQPMTLSELASQLSVDLQKTIDTDRLYRLMRYLVHLKFFTTEEGSDHLGEIKYGLLPLAKFLIRGWPKSMAGLLTAMDKDFIAPWHHLEDGLDGRTDAFEVAFGKKVFDYLSENPKSSQLFNDYMAIHSSLLALELVKCKNVFEDRIKTLVDAGGGTGTTAKAIANAFPHIKCMVYELPHVNADAPVDPNIQRIDGDIFKSVPKADAILMQGVLHDWNDDECIQILKNCRESIPQDGGKVIIIEVVVNANSNHPYTKIMLLADLDMLIHGGRERTDEEWKKLLEAAGFTRYKLTEISAMHSIIEAYPY